MATPTQELTYQDYLQILRRRWFLVVATGVVGLLVGAVLAYVRAPAPYYGGTAVVHYNPLRGFEVEEYQQAGRSDQDLAAQATIIKGLQVLGNAAKRLGDLPEDVPPESYHEHLPTLLPFFSRVNLSMNAQKPTGNIQIQAIARSPELASATANAVAEAYRERNIEILRSDIGDHKAFLQAELEKNEDELNEQQLAYETYRRENPEVDAFFSRIAQSEALARSLGEKVRESRRQLELVRSGRPPSDVGLQLIVGAAGTARLHQLSRIYTQLRVDRFGLLTELTEAHPTVWQKTQQLESIRQELEDELQLILDAFQQQKKEEEDTIAELHAEVENLSRMAMALSQFSRRIRMLEELGGALRIRLEQAILRESGVSGQVRLIASAVPLPFPINPPPYVQLGALGLGAGLFAGFLLAVLIETSRFSTRTLRELEQSLGVPVLAVNRRATSETLAAWLPHGRKIRRTSPEWSRTLSLAVLLAPHSPFAEAFRTLRANLQWIDERGERVLSVTSSRSREGVTTTALNLALSFAQSGQRALLVEAHEDPEGLSALLGVEREPGLSSLMLGSCSIDEAIRNVTDFVLGHLSLDEVLLGPGVDHLHLLPFGAPTPNAAELLDSDAFRSLLDDLRDRFDVIVFDTPALQSSSEALVVGKRARTVVVVSPDRSRSSDVADSVAQLRKADVPIAGLFANGMHLEQEPFDQTETEAEAEEPASLAS